MALVNVEAREHVLLIGLNRPEKMNAMGPEMVGEMMSVFDALPGIN